MTIAVTGATGHLGRLVVEKLKTRIPTGEIRALARDPARAADLGVDVRVADYAQTETLMGAFRGVESLLLISGNEFGQRVAQHGAVIGAAKLAGVSHIAYTSLLRADTTRLTLGIEHKATEALIKASGIAYTLLRNGWYTENYAAAIPAALQAGAFLGSAGRGRISAAARDDYAEAAAVILTSQGHGNKTYELAGDVAFSLADLAAEVSHQVGQTIAYNDLPEGEYSEILSGLGLPAPFAAMLAQSDAAASMGDLFDDRRQLSQLIGRPTTPLAAVVGAHL